FSTTIAVYGGTGPLGGLTATGLPPGLTASLSGSSITLSGTPTATGYYSPITLGVVDAAGARVSSSYALTISAPLTMGALTTSQWTVGRSGYSGTITVSGGTAPWGIASATNLPPGLGVGLQGGIASPLTVFFTGTPTTAATYSNVATTVQDTAGATVSGTFSITVNAAPTLGTLSPSSWTTNQPGYSSTLTVAGGTGPFGNLAVTGLPSGLTASLSGR